MAFLKTLVFLFAMVAVALAAEGVREKKQVLLGAPALLAEDGSWWPGKYDPIAVRAALPAVIPGAIPSVVPAAIPSVVPGAIPSVVPTALHGAIPAALPGARAIWW